MHSKMRGRAASEESFAPEANLPSQVQLFCHVGNTLPNGPTTGGFGVAQRSGFGNGHTIRGGRNGSRRCGYDGAGAAGSVLGDFLLCGGVVSHGTASNWKCARTMG